LILLDTNIVSEPLRPAPEPRVVEWIDAQPSETLFLSAITIAELRAGIAQLPGGKRKTGLREDLELRLLPLFEDRVLAFDLDCTQAYADLVSKARKDGRTLAGADAWIAAIAATHGLEVATRDTTPFAAAGLRVINPWRS